MILKKKPSSHLYLILNSKNRDEMYTSIYRAFINSVLKTSSETLFINAVENNSEEPEQFADFFFYNTEEGQENRRKMAKTDKLDLQQFFSKTITGNQP